MLCRRLQPPFKPLLEENEKLAAQSSRQAPEALMPHGAGTQAQINNSNPGVPARMEQGDGKQMPEKKIKMQTSLLYRKAVRSGDFKINALTSLGEGNLACK